MQIKLKFSSKRLLLTLLLCACSVILLQNYDLDKKVSFTSNLICLAVGLAISFLFFIPSVIIKKRTDLDVLSLSHSVTPRMSRVVAAFYTLYFIYTALYFVLPYTDMFHKKYYPDVSPCLVSLLLLACCVYAAYKGTNVITRFGIFLFVFAVLTNILMFSGSISSMDFRYRGFELSGELGGYIKNSLYFVTPSFIAAVFACLSGFTKNFKLRQVALANIFTGLKFALVLLFIWFSLGSYARSQEYQTFILSRVAHFGKFGGIESFYLALATMSVFMILSLFLCCVCKAFGKSGSLTLCISLAAVILLIELLSEFSASLTSFLTSPLIMVIFSFFAAVAVPSFYMFRGGKKNVS